MVSLPSMQSSRYWHGVWRTGAERRDSEQGQQDVVVPLTLRLEVTAGTNDARGQHHAKAHDGQSDGFVGYPVGLKDVIVAEGDPYEETVANVQSAIQFHIETFGLEALDGDDSVIHVFVADMAIAV